MGGQQDVASQSLDDLEPSLEASGSVEKMAADAGWTLVRKHHVPGKPRVFMPYLGFPDYTKKLRSVVEADYEGFDFASAASEREHA